MNNINILHLSDLHFGVKFSKETSKGELIKRKSTIKTLIEKIKEIAEENKEWKPDIITITGDIGYGGKKEDYSLAKNWLQNLLSELDLDKESIITCPGNHDRYIEDIKNQEHNYPKNSINADNYWYQQNGEIYEERFSAYINFSKEFLSPLYLNKEKTYLAGYRDLKGLRFIVLNSARYSYGNIEDKGELFLGWPDINQMMIDDIFFDPEKYNKSIITIILFHHPDNWLNEQEIREQKGHPASYNYLAERSHIMLSGHVHAGIGHPKQIGHGARHFLVGAVYLRQEYPNNCAILNINLESKTIKILKIEFDSSKMQWIAIFDDIEIYDLVNYRLKKVIEFPKADSFIIENFVERETELQDFREMVKNLTDFKFLFIIGRPGMGKTMLLNYYYIIATGYKNFYTKLINIKRDYNGDLSPKIAEEFLLEHRNKSSGEILWEFVNNLQNKFIILIDEFPALNEKFNQDFEDLIIKLIKSGKKGIIISTSREKPLFVKNLASHILDNIKKIELRSLNLNKIQELIEKLEKKSQNRFKKEFEELKNDKTVLFEKAEGNPDIITKICADPPIWSKVKYKEGSTFEFQHEVLNQVFNRLSYSLKNIVKKLVCIGIISSEWSSTTAEKFKNLNWIESKEELLNRCILIKRHDNYKEIEVYKIHDLLRDFIYKEKIEITEKKELHDQIAIEYIADSHYVEGFDHLIEAKNNDLIKYYDKVFKILVKFNDFSGIERRILKILNFVQDKKYFLNKLLVDLSEIYLLIGNVSKQLELQEKVNSLYLTSEYQNKMIWISAESYRVIGKYHESIIKYKELIRKLNTNNNALKINCFTHMAKSFFLLTEYVKSIKIYKKRVLPFYKGNVDYKRGFADALYGIAKDLRLMGEYDKGIEYSKKALQLYNEIGNYIGIANSRLNIGAAWRMMGKYEKALEQFNNAKEILENIGFRAIVWVQYDFAELNRLNGEFENALEIYKEVLEKSKVIGDKNRIAHAYLGIAETYRLKGEYFEKIYQNALDLYREIQSNWGIINTFIGLSLARLNSNLSINLKELKKYKKATKKLSLRVEGELIDKILNKMDVKLLHPLNFP